MGPAGARVILGPGYTSDTYEAVRKGACRSHLLLLPLLLFVVVVGVVARFVLLVL